MVVLGVLVFRRWYRVFWCSDGGTGCFGVQTVVLGVLVFRRWYWVFWCSDGGTGCFGKKKSPASKESSKSRSRCVCVCVCVCVKTVSGYSEFGHFHYLLTCVLKWWIGVRWFPLAPPLLLFLWLVEWCPLWVVFPSCPQCQKHWRSSHH